MGKAQSKRSVDITTAETAKDNANAVAEGAGELKKIDDVDQLKPQLNGDTHTTADETTGTEPKVESDAKETEKDATTKSAEPTTGSGDTAPIATPVTDDIANKTLETTASNDETLNESAKTTESAAAEDSGKKKKEKVKKKWSFRSISFSKKDKQKPVKDKKKEEEKEKATNGECEKVPEETTEEATPTGLAAAALGAITKTSETVVEKVTEVLKETAAVVEEKVHVAEDKIAAVEEKIMAAVTSISPMKETAPTTEGLAEALQPVLNGNHFEEAKKDIGNIVEAGTTITQEKVEDVAAVVEEAKTLVKDAIESVVEKIEVKTETEPIVESKTVVNEQIESTGDSTPPPLPTIPPPSQVMVFAESAMAATIEPTADPIVAPVPESPAAPASVPVTVSSEQEIVAAVIDQVPIEVAKVEEPVIVVEKQPEPEIPAVVVEEAVMVKAVPDVAAAPVAEEIKETAAEVVEEILEKAVDKVEEAVAAPEESKIEEPASVPAPEETKIEVVPVPEEPKVEDQTVDDLPPPPAPEPEIVAEPSCTTEISVDVNTTQLAQQNSVESTSLPSPPTLSQSDVSLPSPPPAVADEIATTQDAEMPPAPIPSEIASEAQVIVDETIAAATNKLEQLQLQQNEMAHTNGDASVIEGNKTNGTTENGTTNGTNGHHDESEETPATNGNAEHIKEDKISEKAAPPSPIIQAVLTAE